MEVVKKDCFSQRFDMPCFYLPLMLSTCAVETVKSCISLFLLPANLKFPGGHCFGRNSFPTSYQHTKLNLSASLQYLGF